MYNILIAGAGYTGSAIARFFVGKKQKVHVITRSYEKAEGFAAEGMLPLVMNLNQPETLSPLPHAQFVVIAVAPDERTEAAYEHTYIQAVGHLLDALKKGPRPLLVTYLSSTGVWPDSFGGVWVDEQTPARPEQARGKILLRAEQQVLNCGLPAVVLRLAGIYGPGRNRLTPQPSKREDSQKAAVPRWMNMIHVEDIAQAMPVIFKKAEAGSVITCTDHEPVQSPDFYAWLTQKTPFKEAPSFLPQAAQGKRLSNALLTSLGYSFRYPTFREGYQALLD